MDGLSNSAILSLYQDRTGIMWFGTYDGLNLYDGVSVTPFSIPNQQYLSGNIIKYMLETDDDMWVLTNYGVNRVDKQSRSIVSYPLSKGGLKIRQSKQGDVFVLFNNYKLHYQRHKSDSLVELTGYTPDWMYVQDIYIDNNHLLTFSRDGIISYPLQTHDDKHYSLGAPQTIDSLYIQYTHKDWEDTYVISFAGDLYRYDIDSNHKIPIANIKEEITQRGAISSIVQLGGCYFISFLNNGVIKLSPQNNGKEYHKEDLGIRSGIFCLLKDRFQDILWIGTDGQGVYLYSEEPYSVRSVTYQDLNMKIGKPVRSLFLDHDQTLWLGIKGEGLLKIPHYDVNRNTTDYHTELLTTANTPLLNSSVFAFAKSRRPIFWIGTDGGINYYSYADNRIQSLQVPRKLSYVHDLYEENDSTLWIATAGPGIIKAYIEGTNDAPRITHFTSYTIDEGHLSSNYFFTIGTDRDGHPLFGNRGNGVFRIEGNQLVSVPLRSSYDNPTVNDIFSIVSSDSTIWLGSSYGLIKQTTEYETCFNRENGFVNSAIHSIEPDTQQNLWIATNRGLVCFHTPTNNYQTYDLNKGLRIIEFSDGASLRTDHALFFGGINGFAIVQADTTRLAQTEYMPPIRFTRLQILGKEANFHDHTKQENGQTLLTLSHDQDYFNLGYVVADYINASNYTYLYKLEKESPWVDNGKNHSIQFTRLTPGQYTLYIKYRNQVTGRESDTYTIHIHITPPWYWSLPALVAYWLLTIVLIIAAVWIWICKRQHKQQEAMKKLEQEHREEVYEEKLRFFTNITHEFCTPITLIYGPCERILGYKHTDDFIRKYIQLIKWNAERINALIQEMIDFRRIETGHKERKVRPVQVSQVCSDITASFFPIAEQNRIRFTNDIQPNVEWNTDKSCFTKILSNLVSNAFKYTPIDGEIRITLKLKDNNLYLSVYNTGKGIREEDKQHIFNRYTVLDNVEENFVGGLSSRNGLGMAICHSMTKLLEGDIRIESEAEKYARFIVILPSLTATVPTVSEEETGFRSDSFSPMKITDTPVVSAKSEINTESSNDSAKSRVLVIDDNADILELLSDSLSAHYLVLTATDAEKGLALLKRETPDLIVTDIMMPGIDGIQLTRLIKGNKHTMHIPLIILSARNTSDEQVKGLDSGADAYIGKPFNIDYLRATVDRLIENKNRMREYYNSSACAFDYSNGQLMEKEDKDFLNSVTEFIDKNIENAELSPEDLATYLQMSVRALYRKLKDLNQLPPKDFIKRHKIIFSAKLLRTTTLTIQEVIYSSGFNNRAHFYKEFAKYYQTTPKEYRNNNKQKDELDTTKMRKRSK
ncbi:response regulator [Bacteroides sp. AN502(2024)]|uniref:hybrid sensor histidine kinase/response regulator transcription factor n=1 Tax=Bacteroides sp. AN502(2024) TaxID=3160599 RepID=UPI0035188AC9